LTHEHRIVISNTTRFRPFSSLEVLPTFQGQLKFGTFLLYLWPYMFNLCLYNFYQWCNWGGMPFPQIFFGGNSGPPNIFLGGHHSPKSSGQGKWWYHISVYIHSEKCCFEQRNVWCWFASILFKLHKIW